MPLERRPPVDAAPLWMVYFGDDRAEELRRLRALGIRVTDPLHPDR